MVALALTASFELTQEHLILRYEVKNPEGTDAYLLNRLPGPGPDLDLSPDVVYAHLDPATKTLWLEKKLADFPDGPAVTAPVSPYVTPLRAGASFHEEVKIPLPVREHREYAVAPEAAARWGVELAPLEPATFHAVRFSLGYFWRPEGTTESIERRGKYSVVILRRPGGVRLTHGLAESPLVRLDVPVLTRAP